MQLYKKLSIPIFISVLSFFSVSAQKIAFYQGSALLVQEEGATLQKSLKNDLDSYVYETDKKVFNIKDMPGIIELPEDHLFYVGMRYPYERDKWLYVEKGIMGTEYALWSYNAATGSQELVMKNSTGPDPSFQYLPIAWSNDPEVIYLEAANNFESERIHEGIYAYNLKTLKSEKLSISDKYMMTPQISPDRKSFIYTSSQASGNERNFAHGIIDKIIKFNISSGKENSITTASGGALVLKGWVQESIKKTDYQKFAKKSTVAAVSYKMPWPKGVDYCVTRHGVPAPTAPVGSTRRCSDQGGANNPHDYVAIDFGTTRAHTILAVASGKVLFAGVNVSVNQGLGYYVTILHDNGLRSVYGHLSRIDVKVGDVVCQGFPIGFEGSTGNSPARHLHFELRSQFSTSSGNRYPTFSDCNGCTPSVNRSYTSGNAINSSCAPTCKSSLNLTGVIKSGTYKSSNTITASGTIADTRTVVFDAKRALTLKPGFIAKEGATFTAKIGNGCSGSKELGTALSDVLDVSTNTRLKDRITLYPNPSNKEAYLQVKASQNASLSYQLYDVSGKNISEDIFDLDKSSGTQQVVIKTEHLSEGLYFCKIQSGTETTTKKLRIIHN